MALFFPPTVNAFMNMATPPMTGAPFTLGMWVMGSTLGGAVYNFWTVASSANDSDYYTWSSDGSNNYQFQLATLTIGQVPLTVGPASTTKWSFLLLRVRTSTVQYVASLNPDGSITSAFNNTVTVAPSLGSNNGMNLGRFQSQTQGAFNDNGRIGEFWYTLTDILPNDAATPTDLLRQLAYGGPFSVPHVAAQLEEYRSFRTSPLGGEGGDVYNPKNRKWTNTNGVVSQIHPPLPYWYQQPSEDLYQIAWP